MKGFSTESFAKTISMGLRRFAENRRDDPGLIECHNLETSEKGLKLPVTLSSINSGTWGDTSALPTMTAVTWDDIT